MEYGEALNKIHSLQRFGTKPGLERIRKLLALLGNPQERLKFIHVAGTNGKGSVCALTASVLSRANYKTGLYISPYISDFCERMQINGHMIPHTDLAALVEHTFPFVERMAQNEEEITEFEFITALAMQWFAQQNCDVVVLEVGLGGRLDATNVIPTPLVSVILSISLDHTAVLGDTVEKIAYEKCGIIKENGITVCYSDQPEGAMEVIRTVASERQNQLVIADTTGICERSSGLTGTKLDYRGLPLRLPFLGEHQVKNAAAALAVVEVLRGQGWVIPDRAVASGFDHAVNPARLEVFSTSPVVLLDGAHNPGGTAALAAALKKYLNGKRVVAVMGMLADKDVDSALRNLSGLFSHVFTLAPNNPRAMSATQLAQLWNSIALNSRKAHSEDFSAQPCAYVEDAVERALALAGKDGAVVICGSLYLAGEVRPYLVQKFQG